MDDKIVITEWNYSGEEGIHPNMIYKDAQLTEAIMDFYDRKLAPEDVEIFKHEYNVIATSKKFYGAFYEKDLKHADCHDESGEE